MRRNAIPAAMLATYILLGSLSTFTHPRWAVITLVTATLVATWFYNAPKDQKGVARQQKDRTRWPRSLTLLRSQKATRSPSSDRIPQDRPKN